MNGTVTTKCHLETLRRQIEATESQLYELRQELHDAEQNVQAVRNLEQARYAGDPSEWISEQPSTAQHEISQDAVNAAQIHPASSLRAPKDSPQTPQKFALAGDEYKRYGRQMIMPEVGLEGQLCLKQARVLIVGLGGLGCPASAYLAGAGVGTIGLMDGDVVELSNLHRQVAHATSRVGNSKVDSALEYLQALNPTISYNLYPFHLRPESALEVFQQYDLVLDCTDHPTSRYLISDACVLAGKPLVSGSALKSEGQLMVLNNPHRPSGDTAGGPCYRCIFPKPPPAETVLSCGEGGILGPVVGVMGVLQALEAIKVLTSSVKNKSRIVNGLDGVQERPSLLMFSAYNNPQFRMVRLRSRRPDCAACSARAIINRQSLASGSLDYIAFCGVTAPINALPPESRISATDYARLLKNGSHQLIDVRDRTQFGICSLQNSINVPWTGNVASWLEEMSSRAATSTIGQDCYIICRFGNDSQLAAQAMLDRAEQNVKVMDIRGGFKSWREEVDPSWPDY